MTTHSDQHRFFLDLDDDCITLRVECPYTTWTADSGVDEEDVGTFQQGSEENKQRPCWPHHFDDEVDGWVPDDVPQSECTYTSWVENTMLDEILHGRCSVELPSALFSWDNDYGIVQVNGKEQT